jgi:Cu/Zn superoxide dismutase
LIRPVALAALLVIAAACGSTGTGSSPSPSPSPVVTTPVATPTPAGLTFKLNGVKTTANGTITVTPQPSMFTVELKITGLQPTSRHVSHIHVGSCANRGNIKYALNYVVADGEGVADTKTTLRAQYPPTSGKLYVVVHVGPDMATPANSTYLLCGNLFK